VKRLVAAERKFAMQAKRKAGQQRRHKHQPNSCVQYANRRPPLLAAHRYARNGDRNRRNDGEQQDRPQQGHGAKAEYGVIHNKTSQA
jgi:hypothetical protein